MFIEVVKLKCTETTSLIKGPRLSSKHRSRTCWLVSLVDSRLESVEFVHHFLIPKASPPRGSSWGCWPSSPWRTLPLQGIAVHPFLHVTWPEYMEIAS